MKLDNWWAYWQKFRFFQPSVFVWWGFLLTYWRVVRPQWRRPKQWLRQILRYPGPLHEHPHPQGELKPISGCSPMLGEYVAINNFDINFSRHELSPLAQSYCLDQKKQSSQSRRWRSRWSHSLLWEALSTVNFCHMTRQQTSKFTDISCYIC